MKSDTGNRGAGIEGGRAPGLGTRTATRTGKIARLPHAVRDELNRRLLDGEPGTRLMAWLNGREDVQGVLRAYFGGRPINETNLSEWRRGGFEDWRRHKESLALTGGIMVDALRRGLVARQRRPKPPREGDWVRRAVRKTGKRRLFARSRQVWRKIVRVLDGFYF